MIECFNNHVIQHGMVPRVFDELKSLKSQLDEILAREESFWRQKSRELWLSDGDRN